MRLLKLAPIVLFGASLALAESVAAQPNIAIVDAEQAIGNTVEAQQFLEVLEQELAGDRETIEGLQTEIQELQQRVTDEGDVMSETERRNVAKAVEDKRLDLEFNAKKYQNELEARQRDFLNSMGPKFQAVLNDLIEIERYDFVFPRQAVLFVNPRHNITAKITEKLNEQHAEAE